MDDMPASGDSLYACRDIMFRNGASKEGDEVHSEVIRKSMRAAMFVNLNVRILLEGQKNR